MKISVTTKSVDYLFGFISLQMPATNAAMVEEINDAFIALEPIVKDFQEKRNNILAPSDGLKKKLQNHVNIDIVEEGPENDDEENAKIRENKEIIRDLKKQIDALDEIVDKMREEVVTVEFDDSFLESLRNNIEVYFNNNKPNPNAPHLNGVLGLMDTRCLNEILNAIA